MDPAEKKPAAKGRKRQPKKAAKQEDPGEASNQIEELAAVPTALISADLDATPQPTLSQRLTQSLKQLSQLGAQPKKEQEGEEVEQGERALSPVAELPADLIPSPGSGGPGTPDGDASPGLQARRRLHLGRLHLRTAAPPAAAAFVMLLLAVAVGQWRQERQAVGSRMGQLNTQLGSLRAEEAQQSKRLTDLTAAQRQLESQLATLARSHEQLRVAVTAESQAAASATAAELQANLKALEAAVIEQGLLLGQLQQQQQEQEQQLQRERQEREATRLAAESTKAAGGAAASKGANSPGSRQEPQPAPAVYTPQPVQVPQEEVALLVQAEVQRRMALFEADRTFLLSHGTHAGECLPLAGQSGHVDIQLARRINPTAFTYEHIPAAIAFDIRTAPQTLHLYACIGECPEAGSPTAAVNSSSEVDINRQAAKDGLHLLGQLEYDAINGSAVQTAQVDDSQRGLLVERVRLMVSGNHGHPDYTCLYRLRVHGTQSA
ncbi:hypothetical protein N2152v2_008216 [Parachlorella kessleri]